MRGIYLISPGKDALAIVRALQSVLTCYGQDWQSSSINSLAEWEVDEWMTDREHHVILTECTAEYFQRFGQSLKIQCQWWQIMYPSATQWHRVLKQIPKIQEKFPLASYIFPLSSEYSSEAWNLFLDRINPQLLRQIYSQGQFQRLPDIDLEKLYFTSAEDLYNARSSIMYANAPLRTRSTLLSPRADYHTNSMARQLILMTIQLIKIESLNLESSKFQSYYL